MACLVATGWCCPSAQAEDADQIRPWPNNPRYWQYCGQPILLLGGSKDDNLFQIPHLKTHLDDMQAAGANYIRCTMSGRSDGGFEVHEFKMLADGKYDLNQWNDEYWNRFENLLRWCQERKIIVQIEVWDRFDYSRDNWKTNPWNPANNVNFTSEDTGLATDYPLSPELNRQPFFFTVPGMALYTPKLEAVRSLQERRVDKMLSFSLKYPNVLYCIDNETSGPPEWGIYWANYLRQKASAVGRSVSATEMFWALDLKQEPHLASLDHPEHFDFFEGSQNSAKLDPEENWRNLQYVYERLRKHPRPINHTKIYGVDGGAEWTGSTLNAQEKFWRNMIGGSASSRFHRPPYGLGLSETAVFNIKSMRMLTDAMSVFTCEPHNDLLSEREDNEAYCLAELGKQYAVYFTNGGQVKLDVSAMSGKLKVRWLSIPNSDWQVDQIIEGSATLELKPPGEGPWAALVLSQQP